MAGGKFLGRDLFAHARRQARSRRQGLGPHDRGPWRHVRSPGQHYLRRADLLSHDALLVHHVVARPHSTPKRSKTSFSLAPRRSSSRVAFSPLTFSKARARTASSTFRGTTTTPSTSPKTRSPGSTRTPAQTIGTSMSATLPRP